MGKKLDRRRDYGEICGSSGDARFIQDGAYFNAAGDELPSKSPAPAQTKAAGKAKAASKTVTVAAADPVTDPTDQVFQQMMAEGDAGDVAS